VFNGLNSVNNAGDEAHPSTERMWNAVLTERLTLRVGAALGGALCVFLCSPLQGQVAGQSRGFVSPGSSLDRMVTWAADEGLLSDVNLLVRPYRISQVSRSLQATDQATLSAAQRRSWQWLADELALFGDSTSLFVELGMAGYRNGRRDSFRPGGGAGIAPFGGMRATIARGPVVAVVNPAIENRLRDDPEYKGLKREFIAGRLQESYLAVLGERADVLVGRIAQNWGSSLFDGLLLSPSVYAHDGLRASVRLAPFELTTFGQRLNDWPDRAHPGFRVNRYFFAHRLDVAVGRRLRLGFTETGVYGGVGQGIEPGLHAPLNLGVLSYYNDSLRANFFWAGDATLRVGRGTSLHVAGMIDDIQTDNDTLTDQRPTSYGLTLEARWAHPSVPVHVALGYSRITSLAYRNSFEPYDEYSFQRIGLARNFSDYDQWLLRVEHRPSRRLSLSAEFTLIRQGAGDFRDPFPNDTVLFQPGMGFLLSPVQRSGGFRLTGSAQLWSGIAASAQGGYLWRQGAPGMAIAAVSISVRADVLRARVAEVPAAVEPFLR